jgi:hypothetical protein
MLDLSPLFYNRGVEPCFLSRLVIAPEDSDRLTKAKTLIRDYLRSGIGAFSKTADGGGVEIIPRFYTQGSWAYKTANAPCWVPPQQVDYDYGMYLPVSYLESGRPAAVARAYFGAVDGALAQLCKQQGWMQDRSKKACSRVLISNRLHVDIPLYSIPDAEFKTLVEKVASATGQSKMLLDSGAEFSEEVWEQLATDQVLLAKRDGDWEPSDPRKLHNWFLREVTTKGEQLRRICRYMKAWRDFQWKQGGPSSIFLMVCAAEVFTPREGRDDLALSDVVERLPKRLESPVNNPTDPSEVLSERQESSEIRLLSERSQSFADDLYVAIRGVGQSVEESCRLIREHLGDRFPDGSNTGVNATRGRVASQEAKVPDSSSQESYPKVPVRSTGAKPWMR